MKVQIAWVNILKFIGILSVILGHISSPFWTFIFSWHMPLFFMVSGFFINFEWSIKEFIIKDFNKLMIPYVIFALLGLLLEILKRLILHWNNLDILVQLKWIFWSMDHAGLIHHYGFVLRFLPALLIARISLFVLYRILQNTQYQIYYTFLIVVVFLL